MRAGVYASYTISTLKNPVDVLRIVVTKNVVGASDNNTSNILVVRETRRVYWVDVVAIFRNRCD